MNGTNGAISTRAAQPGLLPLPDLLQHTDPGSDMANTLWKDIPVLCWLMNLGDGQLQVRGAHRDPNVSTAPLAMLVRQLRTQARDQDAGPAEFLGALPAMDGTLHHFLIVAFPVGTINGSADPHLAGVALDVTRHKMRVDQLAQQALVDELTGLYNLRGFQMLAEYELKVAHRRETLSAIVYVDVDELKVVNDRQGHRAGDARLVSTAVLLRKVFRECDVIGRVGGDEFVILASDVKGDPENLAERLRAALPAGLSMSIGIACCAPGARMSLSDLISAADQAMYRDKPRKAGLVSLASVAAVVTAAARPGTST